MHHRLSLAAVVLIVLAVVANHARAQLLTVLASFNGSNGSEPNGGLTLSGNTLYGTTVVGGANGDGTVFSVPLSGGTPTVLASFNGSNGENPQAGLTLVGDTLYGTTYYGGTSGNGTVFALTYGSSYVWNLAGGGSWATSGNWSPLGPPDGTDNTADFSARFAGFCARVLAADTKQTCAVTLLNDGRAIDVLVEGMATQDRHGQERLCRAAVIDISQEKHAGEFAAAAHSSIPDTTPFNLDEAMAQLGGEPELFREMVGFFYESEENMFGADVFVIEPHGLLIGKLHDLSGTISKSFVHWCDPSSTRFDTPYKPPPTIAAKHRGDEKVLSKWSASEGEELP